MSREGEVTLLGPVDIGAAGKFLAMTVILAIAMRLCPSLGLRCSPPFCQIPPSTKTRSSHSDQRGRGNGVAPVILSSRRHTHRAWFGKAMEHRGGDRPEAHGHSSGLRLPSPLRLALAFRSKLRVLCREDALYRVHATGQPCAQVIFSERFGGQTPYMVITQASHFRLHATSLTFARSARSCIWFAVAAQF